MRILAKYVSDLEGLIADLPVPPQDSEIIRFVLSSFGYVLPHALDTPQAFIPNNFPSHLVTTPSQPTANIPPPLSRPINYNSPFILYTPMLRPPLCLTYKRPLMWQQQSSYVPSPPMGNPPRHHPSPSDVDGSSFPTSLTLRTSSLHSKMFDD